MQLVIAAIGRSRRADAAPWQDYLNRLPQGGQLLEAESKLPEGPARTKEESEKLLALAERVRKLHAICVVCGASASRTQRLIDGKPARYDDPIILVGGSESYEARCRRCHMVPGKPERKAAHSTDRGADLG